MTYTVPALPAGLAWDAATFKISGTPVMAQASTAYTITASDGTNKASAKISIAVNPTLAPLTQTVSILLGGTISTQALVASGFTKAPVFSISPALPTSLVLNTATGVISGQPIAKLAATTYTITGSDGKFKATSKVSITVTAPPPSLAPLTQTLDGVRGVTITPTAALTASYFTGTVSYTINPALPDGLSFNASNAVISGTPKLPKLATAYTITAKGSTSGTATASLSLNITDNCPTETLSSVEEGRRAYLRLNCNGCHGNDGMGGMGPKIIGQNNVGERVTIGSSSRGMPPFKDYLCGNDIMNMNAYLLGLENNPTASPKFLHWWEQNPSR